MSANETEQKFTGEAGIAVVTPPALIASLFTRRTSPGNIVDLVLANRAVIPGLLNMAYHRPALFEPRHERPVRPRLEELRASYPDVIAGFTDEQVAAALQNNPAMQQRLQEEKEILAAALPEQERSQIRDVEIVLRMLVEDGRPDHLNSGSFSRIATSHEAYMTLWEAIEKRENRLPIEEEQRFLQLGQNLGKARRTYLVDQAVLDQEPDLPRGDEDFQGRIGQLHALSLLISRVTEQGGNPDLVRNLTSGFESYAERLVAIYPDRAPEIKGIVTVVGTIKRSAYVIEPGAAEFSDAERRDYGRQH